MFAQTTFNIHREGRPRPPKRPAEVLDGKVQFDGEGVFDRRGMVGPRQPRLNHRKHIPEDRAGKGSCEFLGHDRRARDETHQFREIQRPDTLRIRA